eukprot:2310114-Amphidinium_carterae.2
MGTEFLGMRVKERNCRNRCPMLAWTLRSSACSLMHLSLCLAPRDQFMEGIRSALAELATSNAASSEAEWQQIGQLKINTEKLKSG